MSPISRSVLLCLVPILVIAQNCPPHMWERESCGEKHCYLFTWGVGAKVDYRTAKAYCNRKKSHLLYYQSLSPDATDCKTSKSDLNELLFFLDLVKNSFRNYDASSGIYGKHYETIWANKKMASISTPSNVYIQRSVPLLDPNGANGTLWRKDLYPEISPDMWYPIDPLLIHTGMVFDMSKPECSTAKKVEDVSRVVTTPEHNTTGLTGTYAAIAHLNCTFKRTEPCYYVDLNRIKLDTDNAYKDGNPYFWYIDPYLMHFGAYYGYTVTFPKNNIAEYTNNTGKTWEREGPENEHCKSHRNLIQLRAGLSKILHGSAPGVYSVMQLFGSFFDSNLKNVSISGTRHDWHLPANLCGRDTVLQDIKQWNKCWFNDWALTLKGPGSIVEAAEANDYPGAVARAKARLYPRSESIPWAGVGCKVAAKAYERWPKSGAVDHEIIPAEDLGCPEGDKWVAGTTNTSDYPVCYYVDAKFRFPDEYRVWDDSYRYCGEKVKPRSQWPQPRIMEHLIMLKQIMTKYGFIAIPLGIERYVGLDQRNWRYTNGDGVLARGHEMWESDTTSTHPCPDNAALPESGSCVCTGIIRKSFAKRFAKHNNTENGEEGLTYTGIVTPDEKQFAQGELKSCNAGGQYEKNFFAQFGGLICEYALYDCRNGAECGENMKCLNDTGNCECDNENGYWSTSDDESAFCERPDKMLCSIPPSGKKRNLLKKRFKTGKKWSTAKNHTLEECPLIDGIKLECVAQKCQCPKGYTRNDKRQYRCLPEPTTTKATTPATTSTVPTTTQITTTFPSTKVTTLPVTANVSTNASVSTGPTPSTTMATTIRPTTTTIPTTTLKTTTESTTTLATTESTTPPTLCVSFEGCDCSQTLSSLLFFYEGSYTKECVDVEKFTCDNTSMTNPCPVVNGFQLECRRKGHCECPVGLIRNGETCDGPLLSTADSSVITQMGDSYAEVSQCQNDGQAHNRQPRGVDKQTASCTMVCYPAIDVDSCHCEYASSHAAWPSCQCAKTSPRRIACVELNSECPTQQCKLGLVYDRQNKECEDIDECATVDFNDCDTENGACVNRYGSYVCQCYSGFEAIRSPTNDNIRCVDVDECALNTTICGPTENICYNLPGAYGCTCTNNTYFFNGTCTIMKECRAIPQLCETRQAYCMDYGPGDHYECRCQRTFYATERGYCTVASHVFEFAVWMTILWENDYKIEGSYAFERLAGMMERWVRNAFRLAERHQRLLQRVAVSRFERDPQRNVVISYVALVFKLDSEELSDLLPQPHELKRLFLDDQIKKHCDQVHNTPEGTLVCTLHDDSLYADQLQIVYPETYELSSVTQVNPCLRAADHNCNLTTSKCIHHPSPPTSRIGYTFTCKCKPGFRAAVTVEHREICIDVNECEAFRYPCTAIEKTGDYTNVTLINVHKIVKCVNTIGSFRCICPEHGFYPELDHVTCVKVDSCNNRHRCSQDAGNGRCEPLDFPAFECVCEKGYTYNNATERCDDVDECYSTEAKQHCQSKSADCFNTFGSYICICKPGFYWDEARRMCRISPYAYKVSLRFANSWSPALRSRRERSFETYETDVKLVYASGVFNRTNPDPVAKAFVEARLISIQQHGDVYINMDTVIMFKEIQGSWLAPQAKVDTTVSSQATTSWPQYTSPALETTSAMLATESTPTTGPTTVSTTETSAPSIAMTSPLLSTILTTTVAENTTGHSLPVTSDETRQSSTSANITVQTSALPTLETTLSGSSPQPTLPTDAATTVNPNARRRRDLLEEDDTMDHLHYHDLWTNTTMAKYIRDRLADLCEDAIDPTGTCLLRGTSLRLPILTIARRDTTSRSLLDNYKLNVSLIQYGCGDTADCNDMQICIPQKVQPSAPYPYRCECTPRYPKIGQIDNKDLCYDPCHPNPCQNKGTCEVKRTAEYHHHCLCAPGFYGPKCLDIRCDRELCSNNGQCTLIDAKYVQCECDALFSGTNCEVNILVAIATTLGIFLGVVLGVYAVFKLWSIAAGRRPLDWWAYLNATKQKRE